MKLHQLQALVACAEAGSIRGAARTLGIAQNAVTRAIRELEATQQLPLIVRSPAGLGFTEYGRALLVHARLILAKLQHAEEILAQLRGQSLRSLSVGVTPWLMLTFLPEAVVSFRQHMPDVQLTLYEGLISGSLAQLRDGSIDFFVGPASLATQQSEFSVEPILNYEMGILVAQGHPCQQARSIHELSGQHWALAYSPDNFDAMMAEIFTCHGASIERQRIVRAESATMLQTLVEHSGMCTVSAKILGQACGISGRIVHVPITEQFERKQLCFIKRRSSVLSQAALGFIDSLVQVIRRRARSSAVNDRRVFETLELLL